MVSLYVMPWRAVSLAFPVQDLEGPHLSAGGQLPTHVTEKARGCYGVRDTLRYGWEVVSDTSSVNCCDYSILYQICICQGRSCSCTPSGAVTGQCESLDLCTPHTAHFLLAIFSMVPVKRPWGCKFCAILKAGTCLSGCRWNAVLCQRSVNLTDLRHQILYGDVCADSADASSRELNDCTWNSDWNGHLFVCWGHF